MSSRRPAASASAVRWRSSGDGRRVARRVVVDEDHAGGVEPDRVAEQLADADQRRRDVALVDGRDAQDVVLRVEHHDPQLLALEPAHLEDQPVGDVVRSADRPAAPASRPSGGVRARTRRRAGRPWPRRPRGPPRAPAPSRGPARSGRRAGPARRRRGRPRTARACPSPTAARSAPPTVRPPTPAQGEPLARTLGDRHLADGPAAGPAAPTRPAVRVSRTRDPSPRYRAAVGRPQARTTGARRFPPPSGPRGRRTAYRRGLTGRSTGRSPRLTGRVMARRAWPADGGPG